MVTWWWGDSERICVQVRTIEPALGRTAKCLDPSADAGTIQLYTLPLPSDPLYTVYFVWTPGGEMRSVEFSTDANDNGYGAGATRPTFATDLKVAAGAFIGSPTSVEVYDTNFNIIFTADIP